MIKYGKVINLLFLLALIVAHYDLEGNQQNAILGVAILLSEVGGKGCIHNSVLEVAHN
jgi:hypothetical protein